MSHHVERPRLTSDPRRLKSPYLVSIVAGGVSNYTKRPESIRPILHHTEVSVEFRSHGFKLADETAKPILWKATDQVTPVIRSMHCTA